MQDTHQLTIRKHNQQQLWRSNGDGAYDAADLGLEQQLIIGLLVWESHADLVDRRAVNRPRSCLPETFRRQCDDWAASVTSAQGPSLLGAIPVADFHGPQPVATLEHPAEPRSHPAVDADHSVAKPSSGTRPVVSAEASRKREHPDFW